MKSFKARQKLKRLSRRSRRGFSLVEMGLVLIVTSFIMQTGIEVATAYTKRQITQRTAATMSQVADDIQSYMDRTYFDLLAELSVAPNNVIERDWNDLIALNLISLDAAPLSPDKGTLRLFFTLRGDTVYGVILSFDGDGSGYSPRPDPNVKFAGRINRNVPTRLDGWDFTLDVADIANLTGEDLADDIGVMRYVSRTVNVEPYLHRVAIPGRPELNTMQADLDMGGFDINNSDTVETLNVEVADEMIVAGRLEATDISSTGDAVLNEMTATNATTGQLNADSMDIAGTTTTGAVVTDLLESDTLTAGTAAFTDLAADNITGGTVFLAEGNYIQVDVTTLNAAQVIADQVFIGDTP